MGIGIMVKFVDVANSPVPAAERGSHLLTLRISVLFGPRIFSNSAWDNVSLLFNSMCGACARSNNIRDVAAVSSARTSAQLSLQRDVFSKYEMNLSARSREIFGAAMPIAARQSFARSK